MIKIIGKRDTGKTKKLLIECGKVNGLYVCKHPERIIEKCAAYNIPLVSAIYYDELEDSSIYNVDSKRPLFIDDIDCYLERKFKNIQGIAIVDGE